MLDAAPCPLSIAKMLTTPNLRGAIMVRSHLRESINESYRARRFWESTRRGCSMSNCSTERRRTSAVDWEIVSPSLFSVISILITLSEGQQAQSSERLGRLSRRFAPGISCFTSNIIFPSSFPCASGRSKQTRSSRDLKRDPTVAKVSCLVDIVLWFSLFVYFIFVAPNLTFGFS
jgi:hypothetical protein